MLAFIFVNKATGQLLTREVLTMRVIKYKTVLASDKKAVLEKEMSVNCPEVDKVMNGPDKVVRLGKYFLRLHEQTEEYLYMLCLNTKLEMTSVFEISHGSVNSSIAGTREIFQKALLANAVSIIMMHNHPSGDCKPSREDVEVTKRLKEAGNILGVQVLDHIIIGDGYSSLKEKGYI
jgi:DNA repair protein RadC